MAFSILLNSASADGPGSYLDCREGKTAVFLVSGTFDAAVKFEASLDGSNWFSFIGYVNGGQCTAVVYSPCYVEFKVEGVAYLRPVVSAYTSGSITVAGYVEACRIGDYSYSRFNAATAGTLVKTGNGTLYSVNVGDAGSGMQITLYDGTSTAGTVISVIKPTSPGSFLFNANLSTGLYVVVTATTAGDFTITYA